MNENITFYQSQIRNVKVGKNVTIVEPVNLYDCTIGDDVFIGPFTEIQSNVNIGNNTRISSHSFICSGVTIGEHCFIGHGVMFVNDKYDSNTTTTGKCGAIENCICKDIDIGKCVRIGSNSTILPVSINDNVVIGAGSVVTRNVDTNCVVCGNPAKILVK
uniref:Acetyltransferase n=1 Tax=viral metagenome TaxID=1070528 RepID=A0A6C0EHI9_9ZZZZ